MASKANIIYRFDSEIQMYLDISKGTPPDERMKKLEQYTSIRNCLDKMNLTEPFINALETTQSLLELADDTVTEHPEQSYTELTFTMADECYRSEQKQLLSVVVETEYESYIDWLKEGDIQFVINESYQTVTKKEILSLLQNGEFTYRELDTLLCIDNPLEYLYSDWLYNDKSGRDGLLDSVKESIKQYDQYLQEYAPLHASESEKLSHWNQLYEKDRLRDPASEISETEIWSEPEFEPDL